MTPNNQKTTTTTDINTQHLLQRMTTNDRQPATNINHQQIQETISTNTWQPAPNNRQQSRPACKQIPFSWAPTTQYSFGSKYTVLIHVVLKPHLSQTWSRQRQTDSAILFLSSVMQHCQLLTWIRQADKPTLSNNRQIYDRKCRLINSLSNMLKCCRFCPALSRFYLSSTPLTSGGKLQDIMFKVQHRVSSLVSHRHSENNPAHTVLSQSVTCFLRPGSMSLS